MPPTTTLSSDHAPALAAPMAQARPREAMLDIAKGIGILLVVLGHNPWLSFDLNQLLSSFRLPFFFFIAGITFPAERGVWTIAGQRADALLKPFAVVVLALSGFQWLAQSPGAQSPWLAVLYGTGFTLAWQPLWFLPHLWLVSLYGAFMLGPARALLSTAWRRGLTLAATLVLGHWLMGQFDGPVQNGACRFINEASWTLFDCGLPFSADVVLMTGFFFLGGHLCRHWVRSFRPNPWLLVPALAVFVVMWLTFEHGLNYNFREYGHLLISTAQAMLGIYVLLGACHALQHVPQVAAVIRYVGQGSLFVLAFHYVPQVRLFRGLAGITGNATLSGLLAWVLCVALCLLMWEIARHNRVLSALLLPRARPRAGETAR